MDESDQSVALQFFKALGDESRLKMAGLLAQREYSVEELAASLALKPPTISHHLGILRRIGLVTVRPEGTTHWYRLDLDALQKMHHDARPEKITVADDAANATEWDRKILRDYFDGERLKQIPVNRKKRAVILNWLAEQFETDARYPEKAVTEIIKRHHEDSATLRRELVGGGWMQRENGIYWRTSDTTANMRGMES
ncbi:MAG: metalloregulator ArsR/SmtB family transcription factor [Thermomicrobiales bacterium]